MSRFPSANNVLPGSLEESSGNVDDAPRQVQMDDGIEGGRVASPKTQEKTFEAPVITIPEDEVGEEKEDNYQLDAVCPPLINTNASGVLRGGRGVSGAGITSEFNTAISCQWICSQVN